jgi:enoyl-CoA hydratase/carnithine racemase
MRANLGNGPALAAMQGAVLEAQDAWARLATPTIAVIEGACTGGGCGLALACDLRLATPQSYFAIPPARLGLIYSLADSKRLVDLVGVARAKEMLFTARRIEAAEAAEIGLINRVVTASQIEAAATELAETIAGNALNSVRGAKKIINAIASGSFVETAESLRLYNESFTSPEFADRSAAFLRRRSGQD